MLNKKNLSESDIGIKCLTPAIVQSGWGKAPQMRGEVSFIKRPTIMLGKFKAILMEALLR